MTPPVARAARPLRLLLCLLVVLLAGACQVRTDIGITVNGDGSGEVVVSVGLDDESVASVGDVSAVLKTADLEAAGWTVTAPVKESDGLTYVRVRKAFANVDEANAILAQIAGATGPFQSFRLDRSRSFAATKTTFDGTVDFSHGLESFADSQLAQSLDGQPLGQDIAAIEAKIGKRLDETFLFRIAVRLPGNVSSNAVASAANGAVWEPKLSDTAPAVLHAKGTSRRLGTLVSGGVAILAVIALAVVLIVRLVSRRRRRPANEPVS